MIRIYYRNEHEIIKSHDEEFKNFPKEQLVWVDLQYSSIEEQKNTEIFFNIDFAAQQEAADIESNSRYYETDRYLYINSHFNSKKNDEYESFPVIFYLIDGVLITKRDADLATFAETVKKMKRNPKGFKDGKEVLENILETKVDLDSDYLESVSREIAQVGKDLSKDIANEEAVLIKINQFQESTMMLRESFVDKQRIVSSLMKNDAFLNASRMKILIKDINSMLEFSSFIFKRLEYLQNTLMGLINLDQNKAIKIFTIVSVVFMPPTLIASIYGMNFKNMPELNWSMGYPVAILLIVCSSLLTLFIFKRKRWL